MNQRIGLMASYMEIVKMEAEGLYRSLKVERSHKRLALCC